MNEAGSEMFAVSDPQEGSMSGGTTLLSPEGCSTINQLILASPLPKPDLAITAAGRLGHLCDGVLMDTAPGDSNL